MCDDDLDEHVWVSEQTISLQEAKVLEALRYDLEIPCIVQWRMLWLSAPTSLNNDLLNDGKVEQSTWRSRMFLGHLYFGINTPRIFFLKAMRKVVEDVPERIWNLEKEMAGWKLGDRPDLLLDSSDSDNEMRSEDR